MRGILKRASAACHPQKKIALDTEQDSTPRPLSLKRRIISIRYTTKHHHKDCTEHRHEWCEERDGTRTRTRCDPCDTGDDVGMEEESADERGAGRLNPSGPDSRERSRHRENHGKQGNEQSVATGQDVPRRMSGKTTPAGSCGSCQHTRGSDGSREKAMRVANI